ncbi:RNA-dependent rna polymerase like protein [Teratosphaeria destructans]|uniref:RNA-dependent RNA polymerase n=1 Tax=Teratosphaeria destructans TaxID=418781 RepID=A0A9W7SMI1_9PEZI|nr:RNA-dependent rna polymerase like protein [Teratosphaeria destructans]
MDVFVRNVPVHATNKQLEKVFAGPFKECGIQVFHAEKIREKPLAVLTVLDPVACKTFLERYGVPQGSPRQTRAQKPIKWIDGRYLQCMPSNSGPSEFSVKSLAYDASQQAAREHSDRARRDQQNAKTTRFDISKLMVGVWDYSSNSLAFTQYYSLESPGRVHLGAKEAIILLGGPDSDQIRIDINYLDCENILLGTFRDPSVSFTMDGIAPKFYKVSGMDLLSAQLTAIALGPGAAKAKSVKKQRLSAVDAEHAKVAGSCFVYRLVLPDGQLLGRIRELLSNRTKAAVPTVYTRCLIAPESWARSMERLDIELTDLNRFGARHFQVRYQLLRLARNGRVLPSRVRDLLPKIEQLLPRLGLKATLYALRRFYHQVSPPTLGQDATSVSQKAMEDMLDGFAAAYDPRTPDNPYELSKRHTHINLIHKVVITPAGTYLEGPEPEPTNRVLRKYPNHTDHFIRVVFQDEEGGSVRYDPRSNHDMIFHERFKQVLDGTIVIAGQSFTFLGFSHSSLRSQSCWFMAPMIHDGQLCYAPIIIKELGDFTHIKTPAKCAARIGQCFTDTVASVILDEKQISNLPIIERNGRDFSDGCGTISKALLQDVWRVYGSRRSLKPTTLQIRFQGAKGVVSLDSRLTGRQLNLRSNMRKFESATSWTLEICGAASRPLLMVLNRQFIKILEDLGIGPHVFMNLQKIAVDNLRCMTHSAINAATLLEGIELPKATRTPALLMALHQIGLDYRMDTFLYKVVEMAVVSKLREIKYRGRIPVSQGHTLYGIMDETGYLKEGEIYVAVESGSDGGRIDTPRNKVIVTRSPAMHPGDVQVVNAVAVPDDSPLKKLSNVVVFSQHGARDLPSQLSGGDLDGDLYNVIWDSELVPKYVCLAADYPRVPPIELDRPVKQSDMSDFFVKFMETDQLGMLCNVHMQLADQLPNGTFSAECIKLAGLASTAVDYSKTGIPINMKECPKHDRIRPDFMAPSPRVVVSDKGFLDIEDEDTIDDEALAGLDPEQRGYRYYESPKALGQLYRNIDERQFLESMQQQHRRIAGTAAQQPSPLLVRLLAYMQKWANQYGIMFKHQTELAQDIRATYDEHLLDIMYQYEPSAHAPLSEHEVFSGNILGRQRGAQGKPLRELSTTMRERVQSIVEYTATRIVRGDQAIQEAEDLDDLYDEDDVYSDREFEALPRAIACLEVAVTERGLVDRKSGELRSFAYIAAGACLRELLRYRVTTFGLWTMPHA